MALTLACDGTRTATLDEFIDHVHAEVDLRDLDSIAAAAPMFRALANDRELVVSRINRQVKTQFRSQAVASAQVIYLGEGRDFYVRANVWPSAADIAGGREEVLEATIDPARMEAYNVTTSDLASVIGRNNQLVATSPRSTSTTTIASRAFRARECRCAFSSAACSGRAR